MINNQKERLSKSADPKASSKVCQCSANLSAEDHLRSKDYRRFYLQSYSPASINATFQRTLKTGHCKLIFSQERLFTRPQSTLSYSYVKKAFYDSNGCLWMPKFLCKSSGTELVVPKSTFTQEQTTNLNTQSNDPAKIHIDKSWIWKKPAAAITAKNTLSSRKSHSAEWSEWMHSPYLRKKCKLSCESRLFIEKQRTDHKCKTWLKSSLDI